MSKVQKAKNKIIKGKKVTTGAILTFNLPEDMELFYDSIHGSNYRNILWDLDEWLRSLHKYQNVMKIDVTEVRKKLGELSQEYGVEF